MGAVIGPLEAPEAIVAGRYRDGVLRMVGRSSALTAAQSRSLARALTAAADGLRGRTRWRRIGSAAPTVGSR